MVLSIKTTQPECLVLVCRWSHYTGSTGGPYRQVPPCAVVNACTLAPSMRDTVQLCHTGTLCIFMLLCQHSLHLSLPSPLPSPPLPPLTHSTWCPPSLPHTTGLRSLILATARKEGIQGPSAEGGRTQHKAETRPGCSSTAQAGAKTQSTNRVNITAAAHG